LGAASRPPICVFRAERGAVEGTLIHDQPATTLRRLRIAPEWWAAIGVFAATMLLKHPMVFKYDARSYWRSSTLLAHFSNPYPAVLLPLRGVLTPLLYFPAALATRLGGNGTAGYWVIAENGLLIALIGAVLIPRLVALWRPVTALVVAASAGLTWLLIVGFAPYPLTDLWAPALMLTAILVLSRPGIMRVILGGVLIGAAVNVRPAYVLPAVLGFGILMWFRRFRGLWLIAGVWLALLPQTILNMVNGLGWYPWPKHAGSQTQEQSFFGSFTVRHDTFAYVQRIEPRQFYCDPSMARSLGNHAPHSTVGLISAYVHHPVQAVVLVSEKLSAVVHWPISAPYSAPTATIDAIFALLVIAVVAVGAWILLSGLRAGVDLPKVFLVVVWIGTIATLATSTPEVRYAVTLVLVGVIGCVVGLAGVKELPRPRVSWLIVAGVIVVIFVIGQVGLSHPAPQGTVTTAVCART